MGGHELPEERAVAIVYYTDLSSEVRCLSGASEARELLEDPKVVAAVLVTEGGKAFKAVGRAGEGPRLRPIGANSLVYPGAEPMKVRALDRLVPLRDLYKSVCEGRGG